MKRSDSDADYWQIGFAEGEITPPTGHTMSGFARERYARGAIAPLMAQALALRDAARNTAVVIAADVLGFETPTLELVRHHLARRHGVAGANVLLAPSHTHWGPSVTLRVNWIGSGPNPVYLEKLEAKLIALADEAIAGLRPASLAYTSLDVQIGHNRRVPQDDGKCEWGIYEQGSYDTHTPVLIANWKDNDGNDPVMVVGHACHPTSTGPTDRWSPDYPGALRERLREVLGARTIFVMGCAADAKVTQRKRQSGELEWAATPAAARATGRRLADAVAIHIDKQEPRRLAPTLQCHVETGAFNFAAARTPAQIRDLWLDEEASALDRNWARQMLLLPDNRRRYDYEMTGWLLGGHLTLFALPSEVCSPLGPRTRAAARTPASMVIGYANVVDAYIPTSQIVREGGYEGESSHRAWFLPAPFTEKIDGEWDRLLQRTVNGLETKK